jgi:ferredoxin
MTWSKLFHDPLGFLWDAVRDRSVRLTIYLVIAGIIFPSSRFILACALLVTLAVLWTREHVRTGSKKIYWLTGAVVFIVAVYGLSWMDVNKVNALREAATPWGDGIKLVQNGTYTGTGEGMRGPITVRVEVADHRLTMIETLKYPDPISVKDNEIAAYQRELLEKGRLEKPEQPGMFRGAQVTLTGYASAIEDALTKGIPDFPEYGAVSSTFLSTFIGAAPTRVTLNSLAILFAAFLVFEYAFQSMLVPGTGRAINCYNCASCVGACPVKEAEGVQMPMGLVLLTRLGDYERVTELSKYCVGCGRCAAKCPIGNSGPLVISAAYQACREMKKEKRLRETEETAS